MRHNDNSKMCTDYLWGVQRVNGDNATNQPHQINKVNWCQTGYGCVTAFTFTAVWKNSIQTSLSRRGANVVHNEVRVLDECSRCNSRGGFTKGDGCTSDCFDTEEEQTFLCKDARGGFISRSEEGQKCRKTLQTLWVIMLMEADLQWLLIRKNWSKMRQRRTIVRCLVMTVEAGV